MEKKTYGQSVALCKRFESKQQHQPYKIYNLTCIVIICAVNFVYNIKLIRRGLQCARENTWATYLQHAYDDIIYDTV